MDSAQIPPAIPSTPQLNKASPPSKAQQAAREFESFFLFQMLEHMSAGVDAPDVYGGGSAETTFRSMLNEKLAAEVSQSSNLGIADAVEKQIMRYQESANRR